MTASTKEYQHQIGEELQNIRFCLLEQLCNASTESQHRLFKVLIKTEPTLWLELITNKIGPEYQPILTRINMLEAALCQIEIGVYGYCCDCEEKIDKQTLQLDAATQRCSKCQRQ